MAGNPFNVLSTARTLRNRGRQVDKAVDDVTTVTPDGATIRDNGATRVRAQPSSYAPRANRQAAYGTPMGAPAVRAETAVERAARGQRNPGNSK